MSSTPRSPGAHASAPPPNLRVLGLPGQPMYSELLGATIRDTYRVDTHLAFGGLADVYEVFFIPGACRQAMKVLRADSSAEDRRRFQHEFRTLLHLEHPGLVRVHHFGTTEGGQLFFTMELLRGRSLDRVFDLGERVEPSRVVRIALQICSALAALHKHEVYHRDIKPSNIMVLEGTDDEQPERVKIIDLGIARLTTGYYAVASNVLELTPTSRRLRTRPDVIVGTPGYIAPEREHQRADARQDVYAVGVTMYRMLTGKRVFPSGDPRHTSLEAFLPDAPPELTSVIERALAGEPTERFASMEAITVALEDALEALTRSFSRTETTKPATARRRPRYLASFALGAAAASLFFLMEARSPEREAPLGEIEFNDQPEGPTRDRVIPFERGIAGDLHEDRTEPQGSEARGVETTRVKTKPRGRRNSEQRAIFRRVLSTAAVDLCLARVNDGEVRDVRVRVRVEAGRAADITQVGARQPAIVDRCLRDAITRLTFPPEFSGTFTHDFTP